MEEKIGYGAFASVYKVPHAVKLCGRPFGTAGTDLRGHQDGCAGEAQGHGRCRRDQGRVAGEAAVAEPQQRLQQETAGATLFAIPVPQCPFASLVQPKSCVVWGRGPVYDDGATSRTRMRRRIWSLRSASSKSCGTATSSSSLTSYPTKGQIIGLFFSGHFFYASRYKKRSLFSTHSTSAVACWTDLPCYLET